jgi:hypothetical protein
MQIQSRQSVGGENDGPSRQFARYVEEVSRTYDLDLRATMIFRRDRYGRGGDHIPFLRQGYPALRFTEPNEDFSRQHQNVTMRNDKPYGDVPEFVDFDYVAKVARLNAATLASLASAPASPRGVSIDSAPSYDTHITWEQDSDPEIAGYALLLRDTTAPTWQRRIDVGMSHALKLPGYNKDDWMFAVETYDHAGHRSVASYARPAQRASTRASTRSSTIQ